MRQLLLLTLLAPLLLLLGASSSFAADIDKLPTYPRLGSLPDSNPQVTVTTAKLREEWIGNKRSGDVRGKVFMKIGDSFSYSPLHLRPLGCPGLATYPEAALQSTAEVFSQVQFTNIAHFGYPGGSCQSSNSFTRKSLAATPGMTAGYPLANITDALAISGSYQSAERVPPYCNLAASVLDCEYKIMKPGWGFILFGINDSTFRVPPKDFASNIVALVQELRARNVIPILSTVTSRSDASSAATNPLINGYNRELVKIADNRNLLIIHLGRAIKESGPNALSFDGVHLRTQGNQFCALDDGTCTPGDLRSDALRFGENKRNYIVLRTLQELRNALRL